MQHKLSYLAKSNPDKLPERVKTRFLAGDKNPFAPHMRHLNSRPRTSRSLTRERSSTPLPLQPCPDSPRHRFDDDGYGHEYSMSSSPEPPRKRARRTSSPGHHRSSGPHRPRSRTPCRSQSPDPRGRSPARPPSWDQVRSMIQESETRMGSALDRMAQTLESLVHQRAPPAEPPRAQAVQDYHPTARVRDYENEEEVPSHEEEDPSSYADSRQQTET